MNKTNYKKDKQLYDEALSVLTPKSAVKNLDELVPVIIKCGSITVHGFVKKNLIEIDENLLEIGGKTILKEKEQIK